MGNEANCELRVGRKRYEGKALLETSELVFRSKEYRAKIAFADIRAVSAKGGQLGVETKGETFALAGLGAAAEKWREKIIHPKTRMEKLGVKAGTRVALVGDAEAAFVAELRHSKAEISSGNVDTDAEAIFLVIDAQGGLRYAAKLAKKLTGSAALWIVYPKGKKEISETDVLDAGRKAGLKDVKVVGFSPTHTALKFVIPVAKR
jgi:hypothetical protein